jgi:DNA mismatch endonuclease (patch repair protein)
MGKVEFNDVPVIVRRRMSRIRKVDTRPELMVRKLVTGLGHRYRLHRRGLPGTPDLTFAKTRKAIFVHGCFWHQHRCALGNKRPRLRQNYWLPKLKRNVARDRETQKALKSAGWKILVVWECEIADQSTLTAKLTRFLGDSRMAPRRAR